MDMEGGPPRPTPCPAVARPPGRPSSVLTEGRRLQLRPPPPPSRPSPGGRALLSPPLLPGPGVREGKRAGGRRRWHRRLVHGCATTGKEAKPGACPGRDAEGERGARQGGERKGLEQRGPPRPASPPSAPAPPAGRPRPGQPPLPRPGSQRLTRVRGVGGQARPRPGSGTTPGPCAGPRGHAAGLTPLAAGGRPRAAAGSPAVLSPSRS